MLRTSSPDRIHIPLTDPQVKSGAWLRPTNGTRAPVCREQARRKPHALRRRTHQQGPPPPGNFGSRPSYELRLLGLFGAKLVQLVVLGLDPVTSRLAIVREQATNLLQRLLIATSRVSIRLASGAHSEPPPSSGAHLSRTSTNCRKAATGKRRTGTKRAPAKRASRPGGPRARPNDQQPR